MRHPTSDKFRCSGKQALALRDEFGQARNSCGALGFVFELIDAGWFRARCAGGSRASYRHFDAIWESRNVYGKLGAVSEQVGKFRDSGIQCGGLQFAHGIGFETGGVCKVTRNSGGSRSQTRVSGELQAGAALWLSLHGYWLRKHRKLPGTPGNNINRRSKDVRCAGLCRWCNTFHKSRLLPFCCTGHKQLVRA